MANDPWNMKPAHIQDWSEQVEEELEHGRVAQDASPTYPSLEEAAKVTKGGRKKKQQQKISLGELLSTKTGVDSSPAYGSKDTRLLTKAELMMVLPKDRRPKDANQPRRNYESRQGQLGLKEIDSKKT